MSRAGRLLLPGFRRRVVQHGADSFDMDFGFLRPLGIRALEPFPVSFAAILLRRFLRSSNILSDAQSVSSIFSLWLVSKAAAVNEWPVWHRYLCMSEASTCHRTPPQFGQL